MYAEDTICGHILHHLTRQRRQNLLPTVSLKTPVGVDSGNDLPDMLAGTQAEKLGAAALSQADFDALIAALPIRQQDVLRGVYEAENPLTVIGQEMNISKQRCRQIHAQALGEIRKQQARECGGVKNTPEIPPRVCTAPECRLSGIQGSAPQSGHASDGS